MENRVDNPADEGALASPDRGLLHIWQPEGHNVQLCPDRVLLSKPVLQVALGEHHGLLLTQGGLVYSFGELSWRHDQRVPVEGPMLEISLVRRTVVRVAAGSFHCGAVTEQGSVYMWGENSAGQCGLNKRGRATQSTAGQADKGPVFVAEPCPVSVVDSEVVPPVAVRVTDLACGREHNLALSDQNELWAWGSGCQLGLVTTTFPVWKPHKVEHLAGRHVIQVACGAYHSLALVRRLPPQSLTTQRVSEQKELSQSPRYLPTPEESFVVDDTHYCPLGVELLEASPGKVCPRRSSPRRRLQTGGKSGNSSPASGSSPCQSSIHSQFGAVGDVQTDSSSASSSGRRTNRNSAFPDGLELQALLQRLSSQSTEERDINHNTAAGDNTSLSSHTSDESCFSSTSEVSVDQFASSYKDESPVKKHINENSSISGHYLPAACVEDVRVSLDMERKSSSPIDINQKDTSAANRRLSLPGTPTHGSPVLAAHQQPPPGADQLRTTCSPSGAARLETL